MVSPALQRGERDSANGTRSPVGTPLGHLIYRNQEPGRNCHKMFAGFSVCVRTLQLVFSDVVVLRSCGLVSVQAASLVCSRVMLKASVARVNSFATLFNPRVRNCLIPRCCFRTPNTGSTIALRRA